MLKSSTGTFVHRDIDSSEIIIIGAGLAGIFTALKLAPHPVTVISTTPLGVGSASSWAQGGIAAAVGEGDTPDAHANDTLDAGAGLVEPNITISVARDAPDRIEDLLSYGIPFDRDLEGLLDLSREAAHSQRRIVRVKGDMAGAAIMSALVNTVRTTPSIRVIENCEARDLITHNDQIAGIRLHDRRSADPGKLHDFPAKAVILATGGVGQLFAVTTNPGHTRGDAIAMAARAGAIIADAEFIQFHPTAINIGKDPAPLATEALRGEGAILVNSSGERFMKKIHDDAELAPRDIVARAVHREITQARGAFLDSRNAIGSKFPEKFPGVYKICAEAGIDPTSDLIPIAPAAHYHMGGVLTDALGRTSLDGLWACGEAASTGLHGANRLASNSLLEAVVFAARIARDLKGRSFSPHQIKTQRDKTPPIRTTADAEKEADIIRTIRQTMFQNVGVVRCDDGLVSALNTLNTIDQGKFTTPTIENMLCTAKLITSAALERQESRGAHFRSDHTQTKEEFKKRSYQTKKYADELCESVVNRKRRAHLNLVHST